MESEKQACRTMVGLLALAHDRACEAELADATFCLILLACVSASAARKRARCGGDRDRRSHVRPSSGRRRLPVRKTLSNFDFKAVPMVSKAQVMALTAGDSWLEKGANLLLFGPPGSGKSHLAAAIGLALVENGWPVLFMRTSDLVHRLQTARRELDLKVHTR
jgi:DNA replication protein DnaC